MRIYGSTHYVLSAGGTFPPVIIDVGYTNDAGVTVTNITSRILTPAKLSDDWNPAEPFDMPVGYSVWLAASYLIPTTGGSFSSIGFVTTYLINQILTTII